MDETGEGPRAGGGKGCGCVAALAVLIVIGLPVLFVFSFGLSPCEDGPCNPNGMRDLQAAAAVVAALAALVGLGVWRLARRRSLRAAAGGRTGGPWLELGLGGLLLLVGFGMYKLIFG